MTRASLADLLRMSAPQDEPLLADTHAPCPFQVGDMVTQRTEYTRYRWPTDGQLAIVSELWPTNTFKPGDNGLAAERADMIILVYAKDEWAQFGVESWRFAKYNGDVA